MSDHSRIGESIVARMGQRHVSHSEVIVLAKCCPNGKVASVSAYVSVGSLHSRPTSEGIAQLMRPGAATDAESGFSIWAEAQTPGNQQERTLRHLTNSPLSRPVQHS